MINEQNDIIMSNIVKEIINSLLNDNIYSFGDWLKFYNQTFDEILDVINDYVKKVNENKCDNIEHWQKVVMLNAIALYMIELEIQELPSDETRGEILKIFVEIIRKYRYINFGFVQPKEFIYISDPSTHKFDVPEHNLN